MGVVDLRLVVTLPLEELQEPQVAVVLLVAGAVRGVRDMLQVVAGVGRQVSDLYALQSVIPARRVVRAASPRGGR